MPMSQSLLVTESSRVLERRFRMFETDRSDADVTIPAGDREQQSSRTLDLECSKRTALMPMSQSLLVTESNRVLEHRFRMFEMDRSDADVTIPAGDREQQSSRTPI